MWCTSIPLSRTARRRTIRRRRAGFSFITYNRLSEGDHRERYYADKRKAYPPDCERDPGKVYEYRV